MPYPLASDVPGEWREGFFQSGDGLRLFRAARTVPNPKALVGVVHGYADQCLRYRHVMDALAKAGYSSITYDYRGHGQAGGRRGYIAAYSDYLADFTAFLGQVRAERVSAPFFLLAHSHGCLVTGMALTEPNPPQGIAGVIMTSPYYKLRIEPSAFQLFQANVVGRIIPFLPVKNPLTEEMLTHDPVYIAASREDPLRHHVVTPKWFTESNAAQATLLGRASQFQLPLLLMIGTDDPIAHPDGGRQFYDAARSTDKEFFAYPGMLHEILHETERDKPIGEILKWLDRRAGARAAA
jgi:alpha-beta hydrolase superfamily lysophospholipase